MAANTAEEIALFTRVGQMSKHHSCVLHDDGSVSIRKLDREGFPVELAPGDPKPDFNSVSEAMEWVERVDAIKPWARGWEGHE